MPSGQPTPQDVHVDKLLTLLSIAFMNDPSVYIAQKIFPIVSVRKQSDIVPQYPKEFWFRDEAKLRAPGTESAGGGYTTDLTLKYFCDNYAFHDDIPDELRKNADQPFDPDVDSTILVTDKLLLRQEKAWASDFFKTTVWQTDKTPVNLWSDFANSDPIDDIETARDTIFLNTARDPKKFVVGRQVWNKLKHHPDFIERIKYTQRGVLTREIVAAILELDTILVGEAVENTAAEAQTVVMSYVYGKHALLGFVPPRPRLRTPSAGYTFHWNVFGGPSFIRRLRDDKAQYDRIEAHAFFDQKLIAKECGYFFNGAVA